jgi:hypothetical protein
MLMQPVEYEVVFLMYSEKECLKETNWLLSFFVEETLHVLLLEEKGK